MNEKQEDLRIRRTHKLLSEALRELMKKKPFEKISVKDICNEAMVHRTTFYSHFEDKYQLLRYCMSEIENPFETVEISEPTFDGYKKYYMEVAASILKQVEEESEFFEMVIKKNKSDSFFDNFQAELAQKIAEKLKTCEDTGLELPAPIDFLANFYAGGCVSIASWWIENNQPTPGSELLKNLDKMMFWRG